MHVNTFVMLDPHVISEIQPESDRVHVVTAPQVYFSCKRVDFQYALAKEKQALATGALAPPPPR